MLGLSLVGGSGPHEGNIMVNGQPVCDDGTEEYRAATAAVVCRFIHISNDAEQLTILHLTNFLSILLLLCLLVKFNYVYIDVLFASRELGYNGASQHTIKSYFGQVSNEFGMDEVQCTGNEASIFDCPHQTTDNCGGSEGLGVICSTGEFNQLPRVRYPKHSYNDNY